MTSLFQDELNYLRQFGREYCRIYPELEKYLGESSTDPDVERLLQGFAFLTARVRERVEDELPELTNALIEMLWPPFLRPFPPVTMLKFTPQEKAITGRQVIPRGTCYDAILPDGTRCAFRTTADCAVYPLELEQLRLERSRDRAVLELKFTTLSGLPLSQIKLDTLRLQFCGERTVAQMLYLWTNQYIRSAKVEMPRNPPVLDADGQVSPVQADAGGPLRNIPFPPDQITAGALAAGEALLGRASPHFEGYRLLSELYNLPDKFHCVDVTGLAKVMRGVAASTFSLVIEYDRPLPAAYKVEQDSVRLYCVPAINLFAAKSAPLLIKGEETSFPVVANDAAGRRHEIFDFTRVAGPDAAGKKASGLVYQKYESLTHKVELNSEQRTVYYRHRMHAELGEAGWRHAIAFVGHDGEPAAPQDSPIEIDLACFDGATAELPVGSEWERSSGSPSFATVTNLTVPTAPVYPPLDGSLNWRVISNLSLNFLSLRDRQAFASIISVYDYQALNDRQAERAMHSRAAGIVDLATKPVDRLFTGRPVRGLKSVMKMRESNFASTGEMFLFASVLAEFMALYATTNSFHQLEVTGVEKNQTWLWPAKTGLQPLI